jgi:Lipocalin-like domain/CrtC N-terminal lipocalin domain
MNMTDLLSPVFSQQTTRRSLLAGGMTLGAVACAPALTLASASAAAAAPTAGHDISPPLFDPDAGLFYLPQVVRNSWFMIGYIEAENGHKFNCLVHQIIGTMPGEPLKIASILNITDISGHKYRGEERVHSADEITLATDRMMNVLPTSTLEGDRHAMHVQADFGWGSLDFKAEFPGHIMLNGGSGVFGFLGGTPTIQYSIPWGKGDGFLTLDGVRHACRGTFWFDRQWGLPHGLFNQAGIAVNPKDNWIWMDLNLSNGVALGLWDLVLGDQRYSWVTVLYPDGKQIVTEMEPLLQGASAVWASPVSGQSYPTRFKIKIPELDCILDVTAVMENQEIVSPTEPKYEGVADIVGTFKGENVTGYTLVEMVGNWRA